MDTQGGNRYALSALGVALAVGLGALLAFALLLPVFSRTHHPARATHCYSNMKQIAMALAQYAQDNGEALPSGTAGDGSAAGWMGPITPYLRGPQVVFCPSEPVEGGAQAGDLVSYGLNGAVAGATSPHAPAKRTGPAGLAALAHPERTVLLFEVSGVHARVTRDGETPAPDLSAVGRGLDGDLDCGGHVCGNYATGPLGQAHAGPDGGGHFGANARHADRANYAVADGHCRWLQPAQVSPGYPALKPADAPAANRAAGAEVAQYAATFSTR